MKPPAETMAAIMPVPVAALPETNAARDANTSGDPLPSASSVTPAVASLRRQSAARRRMTGQKYSSAVSPRRKNAASTASTNLRARAAGAVAALAAGGEACARARARTA